VGNTEDKMAILQSGKEEKVIHQQPSLVAAPALSWLYVGHPYGQFAASRVGRNRVFRNHW
jgi:hypothetical protein